MPGQEILPVPPVPSVPPVLCYLIAVFMPDGA